MSSVGGDGVVREQAVRTRAGGVDAGERADIAYEVSEGIPNRIC